jgi:hypothetical protein
MTESGLDGTAPLTTPLDSPVPTSPVRIRVLSGYSSGWDTDRRVTDRSDTDRMSEAGRTEPLSHPNVSGEKGGLGV